jgi:hypothetical protein
MSYIFWYVTPCSPKWYIIIDVSAEHIVFISASKIMSNNQAAKTKQAVKRIALAKPASV